MVKRKSSNLGSRTKSSKTPRASLSELNGREPVLSQGVSNARETETIASEVLAWPVSPPRPHIKYVPPTPRADHISISSNITLSLEVKDPAEPTKILEERPATPPPAADATHFEFTSVFLTSQPQDESVSSTLRPVFDWSTPSYISALYETGSDSDNDEVESEIETKTDEEADKSLDVIGKECDSEVTQEENAIKANSVDEDKEDNRSDEVAKVEEINQGADKDDSGDEEERKAEDGVPVTGAVRRAPEQGVQDAETASENLSA